MKLQEFICERNGKFSGYRFQFLLWNIVALIVWAVICIKTQKVLEIHWSVLALLGVSTGGMVIHRLAESRELSEKSILDKLVEEERTYRRQLFREDIKTYVSQELAVRGMPQDDARLELLIVSILAKEKKPGGLLHKI